MGKPLLRPSGIKRALNCGASIRLLPLVSPRKGDEGDLGSSLHYAIADRLVRELGAIPPDGGLKKPEKPVPQPYAWLVDWAVRHVRETVPDSWTLYVEIELGHSFAKWDNLGHIDILAMSPDGTEVIIIDWKTGRAPQDPAAFNEQLNDYLVLVKMNWPEAQRGTVQLCQPLADEESGFERVSSITVEPELMERIADALDSRIEVQLQKLDELRTGPWCDYCPVGAQCPALQEEERYMKMKLTPEALARIKAEPDDPTLTEFVEIGRRLARPVEDATEMLKERIEANGGRIPKSDGRFFRLKDKPGKYKLDDTAKPERHLSNLRSLGVTDEFLAPLVSTSVEKITDQVWAANPGISRNGEKGISASGLVDATIRPLLKQSVSKCLVEAEA